MSLAERDGADVAEQVESLGEGWVAEEALAIAVFCALRATSLVEGVLAAVNHGGDSDTASHARASGASRSQAESTSAATITVDPTMKTRA